MDRVTVSLRIRESLQDHGPGTIPWVICGEAGSSGTEDGANVGREVDGSDQGLVELTASKSFDAHHECMQP